MKSLLIGLGALALAHTAAASPCGDRIAKLQARASGESAAADPTTTAGGATETADAKLHHQPTAATPGDAGASADSEATLRNARFENEIYNAQAAEHSGDMAACEAAVAAAEKQVPR